MSTPISINASTAQTLETLIENIERLGNFLNLDLTASDVRFRTRQDDVLKTTALEAERTLQQARAAIQTLRNLEEADTEAESLVHEDGSHTASNSADTTSTATAQQSTAPTATSASTPATPPAEREFERVPLATDPETLPPHQSNLASATAQRFSSETSPATPPQSAPGDTTQPETTLSSAQGNTPTASETTLSSASTTLSSGEETSASNKYVGYVDSSSTNTAEYASYNPGVTMSKQNLQELSDLHNKVSYGPEIFEEIWFEEDGEASYDEYYDDYYDDGYGYYDDYGFVDGYEGEAMVLVGNPTDQTMLDVSQVTFERPQDMTVSKEEFDAIFEEIMWRAAIDDPVAKDKWYQTLMLIAENESNMNPAAANGWDSNAVGATQEDGYPAQSSRGMFQTIPGTFAANHMGGTSTSIYDPAASMGAAVNYLMNRYGCDRYGNGLDAFYSARVPVYHGY